MPVARHLEPLPIRTSYSKNLYSIIDWNET